MYVYIYIYIYNNNNNNNNTTLYLVCGAAVRHADGELRPRGTLQHCHRVLFIL